MTTESAVIGSRARALARGGEINADITATVGAHQPGGGEAGVGSSDDDELSAEGRRSLGGSSLVGERASTYLALVSKGLRPVAMRRGKAPSGVRGSRASLSHVDKIVWEAGPAARRPDWALLPEAQRAGAARAFRGGSAA